MKFITQFVLITFYFLVVSTQAQNEKLSRHIEDLKTNGMDTLALSDTIAILVFSAKWCNPCKIMYPELNYVINKYHKLIKFIKIDIDLNPVVAHQYSIRSIPAIVFVKNGKNVNRLEGLTYRDRLEREILKVLERGMM